jgi:nitrite reductase (NADH) small subunit
MALTFSIDDCNLLRVADQIFFVRTIGGQLHLLPSRCPHRGGPLRFGRVEDGNIVCPWHGTRVHFSHCVKKALPIVFRRHAGSVVVLNGKCDAAASAGWAAGVKDVETQRAGRPQRSSPSDDRQQQERSR